MVIYGEHYGPELVTRLLAERWHKDCVNEERPGQTHLMFWAAIIYSIPPADCPYFVWEEETDQERQMASEILKLENEKAQKEAEEKDARLGISTNCISKNIFMVL
jgi:hypothetical protein